MSATCHTRVTCAPLMVFGSRSKVSPRLSVPLSFPLRIGFTACRIAATPIGAFMKSHFSYSKARLDRWNSRENDENDTLARLKRHSLSFFLLCSLSMLSACGGGSVTPPPPPPPPPPAALQITSSAPPSGTLDVD